MFRCEFWLDAARTLVFLIDRCLGRNIVAQALREVGETVEIHDDHAPAREDVVVQDERLRKRVEQVC